LLLARHLLDRTTPEDTVQGIEYLKQAIALEPGFASAWAELGLAYARQADQGSIPVAEGYGRSREAAERALSLEPELAGAHLAMGRIRMGYDWDWPAAEASLRRARELDPGNARLVRLAGTLARSRGRIDESIDLTRQALELDPLSAGTCHNLGGTFANAERFEEAEEMLRRALELTPQRSGTRASLSITLGELGRVAEALAASREEPEPVFRSWALAITHHRGGHPAESDEALRELTEAFASDAAFQIAQAHAARGDVDAAFEWLERAYAQRDGGVVEAKVNRLLQGLRGDPRWRPFLKKLGLED